METTTPVAGGPDPARGAAQRLRRGQIPSRPEAAPPAPPVPTRRTPGWVKTLEAIHGAAPTPAVPAVDFAVVAAVASLAGMHGGVALLAATSLIVAFYVSGVYADRDTVETQGALWYPGRVAVPTTLVTLGAAVADGHIGLPIATTVRSGVSALAALTFVRGLTWAVLSTARRRGVGLHPTLVIGCAGTARRVAMKLAAFPEAGLVPAATIPLLKGRHVGLSEDPSVAAARLNADHAVLAPSGAHEAAIAACLESLDGSNVRLSVLPPLEDLFLSPGLVTQVGGLPLIPMARLQRTRTSLPAKRAFDVVVASLLLVVLAPVLATAAAAVLLETGRPLLYKQRRVGRQAEVFEMLKFRSMVRGADRLVVDLTSGNVADGLLFKVKNDPRVTRVGRVLRRYAVDELPQLWNVVRGDMSLVGPRPLAVEPTDFGPLDNRRHAVRPGITGYWQISGGNGLTWAEMVKLDLAYLENWSVWLDIRLMARTLPAVISRRGPW